MSKVRDLNAAGLLSPHAISTRAAAGITSGYRLGKLDKHHNWAIMIITLSDCEYT